jgi:hypothetical protein
MAGVTSWSYKIAVFTLYDPPLLFIGKAFIQIYRFVLSYLNLVKQIADTDYLFRGTGGSMS